MLHPEIVAGTPATILLYTDSRAAVVTRRTAKRVWVSRVETGPTYRESDTLAPGEMPVILADGLTDQPYDEGESYTLHPDRTAAHRGGVAVVFGHSRSRIDYKF